jgi:hypothetical protein
MNALNLKRLIANQQNAQKSSGPRSEAGKKKVSMNAIKHNFCGQTVIVLEHEREAYNAHFQSFRDEYQPVGPTEQYMVQTLADLSWASTKIRCLIDDRITWAALKHGQPEDSNATTEVQTGMSQGFEMIKLAPSIATLGLYDQRKTRMFLTTRKELAQIQTERKAKQKSDLAEAARIRQHDLLTILPGEEEWHPSQNGFVCSKEEIDRYIARQERFNRPIPPRKATV